mmetsp:Transcript_96498/g.272830  ORF Transcript_96498/g.272830 Transcript_96498/m.272830 type:complete len:286 (+) Transcript_96498:984-1841(+)
MPSLLLESLQGVRVRSEPREIAVVVLQDRDLPLGIRNYVLHEWPQEAVVDYKPAHGGEADLVCLQDLLHNQLQQAAQLRAVEGLPADSQRSPLLQHLRAQLLHGLLKGRHANQRHREETPVLEVGADRLAQLPPTGVRVLLVEYLLEGRALILKSVLVHRKHEVLLREGSCPVQPDHGACGQRRAQVLQRLLGRHAVRDEDDLCADHYSEHIDEGADVCHGVVAPLAIQYDQVLAGRHVLDPRQATGLQQLSHGHRHDVDALGDGLRGVARLEGVLGTNDAGAKV